MKNGILISLAIAITIFGVYWGWTNHSQEMGGEGKLPPPLADILQQDIVATASKTSTSTAIILSPITESDRKQLNTLNDILASRNDNDSRLDKDLKFLTPGSKQLLRERYDAFPMEGRNERGTVVFLLGRNLSTEQDIAFMHKVLEEAPCRSMQNCNQDPSAGGEHDTHLESGLEISLSYPQLVAVNSLERVLERGESDPLYRSAEEQVIYATRSSQPVVAQAARELLARIQAKKGRR